MSGAAGDERSRLFRALALSRRFHLYLARCADPRAADQLIRALEEQLPRLRKSEVHLVRLDPYAGRTTAEPLAAAELANGVLVPLLSPPEHLRAHGTIHVVDTSREVPEDSDAWARFFSLWNEKRNLMQQLGGEVLVLLSQALAPVFATTAPDVWSIRSGEYTIERETEVPDASIRVDIEQSLRAIPPLALFGGDIVIRSWVGETLLSSRISTDKAEIALEERRFDEAEAIFRDRIRAVSEQVEDARDPGTEAHALSGICIALAGQDRAGEALQYGEHAFALVKNESRPWLRNLVLGAGALIRWCVGHFQQVDEVTAVLTTEGLPVWKSLSDLLCLVERGHARKAIQLAAAARPPSLITRRPFYNLWGEIGRVVCADLYFLIGDVEEARGIFGADSLWKPFSDECLLLPRRDALMALIELARGNDARAALLLAPDRAQRYPAINEKLEPEAGSRAAAMHAYASAILAVETDDLESARTWLHRARGFIDDWARTGLDRRSLMRARLTVDLLLTRLEPSGERALPMARELIDKAMALLGDTAEDCIARVLAVQAHMELARRLGETGDKDAAMRRALDLARPLGGLGVPAWDELLRTAEGYSAMG